MSDTLQPHGLTVHQVPLSVGLSSLDTGMREVQGATGNGQAWVWHTAVTGTFLCLGSEMCVCAQL